MRFNSILYPYQKEILNVFEDERVHGEKKIHIVAPPGSGKTIVGLEMICRIDEPTLILVPNLTLQEQWKDKLEKLFLEENESILELVSTSISDIKKINIITYQSLSGTEDENDDVQKKILNIWFESEKDEFPSEESFLLFVNELKQENLEEYRDLYTKHRKKLKESGDVEYTKKLMKWNIHTYIQNLREIGVKTMVVDEAHHLTSWWSHVLYEIWSSLEQPYIIGLTATPPFDNADYFELDESYVKLLGTVDYYVPTPAIVKSGRLAPYSDLVYIVSPDEKLNNLLKEKEQLLEQFLISYRWEIVHNLHIFLEENFDRLKVKSLDLLEKWMRFIYRYKDESIDMSGYITKNASQELTLEDIAKSIWKWASNDFKTTKKTTILNEVKTLFFDLGYIWRWTNLYRFETPIEKWLIYSKSKIEWVYSILDKEIENIGESLRVAVITDFLDVESDWINGHYIFDEVIKKYGYLNPYLVSGQGIWRIENNIKTLVENETILSVTEKLAKWETKIVIGTRGILGEGWDCPEINTLIDLTGVSAYMSVNQVHGRAIRLNLNNLEKVANIYDIICIGKGFQWMRDFNRLERKHSQFYWVDDSGLIIKELDHIYPQLEKYITKKDKINSYTLRKSALRSMVKELWNIGSSFKNEEVFSLSIEIQDPYSEIYIPNAIDTQELVTVLLEKEKWINLLELWKTTYHSITRQWINELILATIQVLKPFKVIPSDFTYSLRWTDSGSIKITGNDKDQLINKKFLEIITPLFSPITEEKYIIKYDKKTLEKQNPVARGPIVFMLIIIFTSYLWAILLLLLGAYKIYYIILSGIVVISWYIHLRKKEQKIRKINEMLEKINTNNIQIGLPDITASNEEKRQYFLWKKYPSIPEKAKWFKYLAERNFFFKTPKILWVIFILLTVVMVMIFVMQFNYILSMPTIGLSCVFAWILGICIFLCINLIHYFYTIYARIFNYFKQRKIIQLSWSIWPTTQEDISKRTLLNGKIEKLWI